jgi:hypothetical protein
MTDGHNALRGEHFCTVSRLFSQKGFERDILGKPDRGSRDRRRRVGGRGLAALHLTEVRDGRRAHLMLLLSRMRVVLRGRPACRAL